MHLWLIGMMGSGKSVVGQSVSQMLNRPFVDLDRKIEAAKGTSVSAIFEREGEDAFRAAEAEALDRAASRASSVIATGGGAILRGENVVRMRATGTVIWLAASPDTLVTRLVRESAQRPLLADGGDLRARVTSLLAQRKKSYASAAHVKIATDGLSSDDVARRVSDLAPIPVTTPSGSYDVHVGRRALERVGDLVRAACGGDSVAVVTDSAVAKTHAARVVKSLARAGFSVSTISIKGGEKVKTLATVSKIWNALLAAGCDRGTPIVAVGGGVIGDLAGFAAATFLRGVPVVHVPTTLVAQVDSAIGGKTGFDLSAGKNLIGAFKHPACVIADPDALETLPQRELRAGFGEVVKYGAIADAELFTDLERGSRDLDAIVRRCVRIKAGVVSRDPSEKGERAILNFGHTVGHAIEAASGYRALHGEAVAAGMVAEAELAADLGACESEDVTRLAGLLHHLSLPIDRKGDRASRFVSSDKKRKGSVLTLPVLRRIGHVELRAVPVNDIVRFLLEEKQ